MRAQCTISTCNFKLCSLVRVFVVIFFSTILIRFGFCEIRYNQGLGKCCKPLASVDKTYLDLDYSEKKKTHPIIVNYAPLKWKFWSSSFTMDQTSSCASKPETENKWTFSLDSYPSIRSGEGVALDPSLLKSLWRWSVHLTVGLRGSRFRASSSSCKES